ncbi:MAG: phosphoesterase [Phenylobacterium sp.]|nr:MAG: phosphoesterase [Phenylobacterium sp.]
MMMSRRVPILLLAAGVLFGGDAAAHDGPHAHFAPIPGAAPSKVDPARRAWLAGDHHVHSWFSVSYKASTDGKSPPEPIKGGDASNPITTNAKQAAAHGLSWMVATDHGGPDHAKLNREQAYPEVLKARRDTSGLLLFFGMELDTPGAEHSSVIVPRTPAERDTLFGIESGYNRRQPWPADPAWDTEARMVEALKHMGAIKAPPVVIANHPSRTATAVGVYGQVSPSELRNWNDAAPQVAVGMEGAPGHQAGGLKPDGSRDPEGRRGSYGRSPTLGGFDQMTARLGGFWDSMLGEGRRWWVTSTSDSHRHYTDGGNDFWPGEYSKTYVRAARTYDDVLDGLRNGRVFVTLGDLVSEVDVIVQTADGRKRAEIGGRLRVARGSDVTVVIRVRDPAGANFGGRTPEVRRVDLIRSEITGPVADRTSDSNPRARVEKRFGPGEWAKDGERIAMAYTIRNVTEPTYLRVRGTNGAELEPQPDPAGEDPWSDLWFYANPVFIDVAD